MSTSCLQLRMLTSTQTTSSIFRKVLILRRDSQPTTVTLSQLTILDMVNSSSTTITGENSPMGLTVPAEDLLNIEIALMKNWVLRKEKQNSFLSTQRVMK